MPRINPKSNDLPAREISGQFRFTDLPREVRDRIYEAHFCPGGRAVRSNKEKTLYLFGLHPSYQSLSPTTMKSLTASSFLSLLTLNHTLGSEAANVLSRVMRTSEILFFNVDCALRMIRQHRESIFTHVIHVSIELNPSNLNRAGKFLGELAIAKEVDEMRWVLHSLLDGESEGKVHVVPREFVAGPMKCREVYDGLKESVVACLQSQELADVPVLPVIEWREDWEEELSSQMED